jgi:hypothetical protein
VLKSYNLSHDYTFYFPKQDPHYIGEPANAQEQVANQVLTYDVNSNEYVWAQSQGSSIFLQGQTDDIGDDDHGNVLTIKKEERIVAGDPFYDPLKDADEQLYKATYEFTDNLYNMKEFTAGKKIISRTFTFDVSEIVVLSNVATLKIASANFVDNAPQTTVTVAGSSLGLNGDITTYNINADSTPFELSFTTNIADVVNTEEGVTISYTIAEGTDHTHTTGLYFDWCGGEPNGGKTRDEKNQLRDKLILQTKGSNNVQHTNFTFEPLKTCLKTVDTGAATKSSVTLSQATHELCFHDDAKFAVDNSVKTVATDMSTIEFGSSSSKHRLAIINDKLFIQKKNSSGEWVGADLVVDTTNSFTSTISSMTATDTAGTIKVDVQFTDGNNVAWKVKLDDGDEQSIASGTLSADLTSTHTEKHTVVAWAIDGDSNRISEYKTVTVNASGY